MSLSINSSNSDQLSQTVETWQKINLKKWQKNDLRLKVTEVDGERVLEVEKTSITKKIKNKDIPKLVNFLNEELQKLSKFSDNSFERNCNIFHGEVFEYNKSHRNASLRFANPYKKTITVKVDYPWLEEGKKITKKIRYSRRFVTGRTQFRKILNSIHKKLKEQSISPEALREIQGKNTYLYICENASSETKISDKMKHGSTLKLKYDSINLQKILSSAVLSYDDGYRDARTEFKPKKQNKKKHALKDAFIKNKERILPKRASYEKLPKKGDLKVKIQYIWLSCKKDIPSEKFFKELKFSLTYSKGTTFEEVLHKIDAILKKNFLRREFLMDPENESFEDICKLAKTKTTIAKWMETRAKKSEILGKDFSNTILLKYNNIDLERAIEAVQKPYEDGFTEGLFKIKKIKNNGHCIKTAIA